jgi:hypothetical protein
MVQEPKDAPRTSPLKAAAIVVYATFALLAFTIPQAVPNWLKNMDPGPAQSFFLDTALAVQEFSNRMGANWPYFTARRIFLETTGKSED